MYTFFDMSKLLLYEMIIIILRMCLFKYLQVYRHDLVKPPSNGENSG